MHKCIVQGDCDGLCGIYSALNAANALLKMNKKDHEILFKKMVYSIADRENFAYTIINGINAIQMGKLVKLIIQYAQKYYEAQVVKKKLSTDGNNAAGVWRNLSDFINANDGRYRVIIVGLENKYEHWTCISRITRASLHLIDSSGIKIIKKSAMT